MHVYKCVYISVVVLQYLAKIKQYKADINTKPLQRREVHCYSGLTTEMNPNCSQDTAYRQLYANCVYVAK